MQNSAALRKLVPASETPDGQIKQHATYETASTRFRLIGRNRRWNVYDTHLQSADPAWDAGELGICIAENLSFKGARMVAVVCETKYQ